jgi:hypothetical protein
MAFTMDAQGRVLNTKTDALMQALRGTGIPFDPNENDPQNVGTGTGIKNAAWLLARINEARSMGVPESDIRQFGTMPSDWIQGRINQFKHRKKSEFVTDDTGASYTQVTQPNLGVHGSTFDKAVTDARAGNAPPLAGPAPTPGGGEDGGGGGGTQFGTGGSPGDDIRSMMEGGVDPALSVWEEMNRSNMLSGPFTDLIRNQLLQWSAPQGLALQTMENLRGQDATPLSSFLQHSYTGMPTISPEDLQMLASGMTPEGSGINQARLRESAAAFDNPLNRQLAYQTVAGASPFRTAPAFIRSNVQNQANDAYSQYRSMGIDDELAATEGSDYLTYLGKRFGMF